jgi:outer membrane protein assembly factor BamB
LQTSTVISEFFVTGLKLAISAKDGKEIYRERVNGLTGRPVYASPAVSENRLYLRSNKALYCVGEE